MATIGVVVVLLVAGAWVIGSQLGSSPAPRHHPAKHSSPAAISFTQFKDPAGMFVGGYPSNWQRLQTSTPQAVLLAASTSGASNGASFLVEKTPIGGVVTSANLAAAKGFTNRIVHAGKDVKLLRAPEPLVLGGLPGYLYLYTFLDSGSGQLGAHAHYFLFDGKTMITLVFQSLPSTSFVSQARLFFDPIASKFRALPGG